VLRVIKRAIRDKYWGATQDINVCVCAIVKQTVMREENRVSRYGKSISKSITAAACSEYLITSRECSAIYDFNML
jgi:hypothetical protein